MAYTQRYSKYGAKSTEYNGERYDSKFEAKVAHDLDMQLRAGEIAAVERQYKVVMIPYAADGRPLPSLAVSHKIDFRVTNLDGSYTLVEAKGLELADYQRRRKWLEAIWLPEHPDHDYVVIKQTGGRSGSVR